MHTGTKSGTRMHMHTGTCHDKLDPDGRAAFTRTEGALRGTQCKGRALDATLWLRMYMRVDMRKDMCVDMSVDICVVCG